MRKATVVIISAVVLAASAGCESSTNRAPEGAVIGGLLGAGAGMIVGNQGSHRGSGRAEGALIGGAVGALGGAIVGSSIQKQPAQQQQQVVPQQPANPNQMSIGQIVDLTRQGVNEDVIIDRIRMSNSKFSLTAGDVEYLKSQGVSPKVTNAMQGYY